MNIFSGKQLLTRASVVLIALVFSCASFGWADTAPASAEDLAKINKQLLEKISDLTNKVDQLENRVVRAERAPQTAAISAPAGAEGDGVLRTTGGDIRLDGFVDTSFNWNFVTPNVVPPGGTNATGNSTLRAFDRESDTFDINNIQLNLYRPAPDSGGVGFRTEFMYGTDAQVAESAGFLGGTDEFSIQEAFVELKAPIGTGLTVWAGKFATLLGAEVIENHMNWNSSRSYLFTLAIPFTHTGVRAMYNWLDGKIGTTIGLVNGWDSAIDNNKVKDIEAQIKWAPTDNFSIVQNFMGGSQIADDRGDNRYIFDTVASWTPLPKDLPKLHLMANYDYGVEERLGDTTAPLLEGHSADWQGYALYAKYDLYDWLTLGARWEQFWDDMGVRTATADELWEMTYTADIKVYKNLLTRLEYRHDHSNTNNLGVKSFDTGTENNQDTVGISMIYLFG